MKKIALFAAAMMMCIGIACAQEPVKKDNNKNQTTQVAKPQADKPQASPGKTGCGKCPHHNQCNNTAAKPDNNRTTDKSCGNNSNCQNHNGNKSDKGTDKNNIEAKKK